MLVFILLVVLASAQCPQDTFTQRVRFFFFFFFFFSHFFVLEVVHQLRRRRNCWRYRYDSCRPDCSFRCGHHTELADGHHVSPPPLLILVVAQWELGQVFVSNFFFPFFPLFFFFFFSATVTLSFRLLGRASCALRECSFRAPESWSSEPNAARGLATCVLAFCCSTLLLSILVPCWEPLVWVPRCWE